jgi:hypothetical protein
MVVPDIITSWFFNAARARLVGMAVSFPVRDRSNQVQKMY